jgi:teichuronic acid biosynthesis glycosyltransferase TuaH
MLFMLFPKDFNKESIKRGDGYMVWKLKEDGTDIGNQTDLGERNGTTKRKTVHVIVAAGEWKQDGLRYRRHRLAKFLQKQPETKNVVWLCPSPHITEDAYSVLPNGVNQVTITDIMPHKIFRFGRYMDVFYQSKLRSLLFYLDQVSKDYRIQLWYTFPGFPLLADLISWDQVVYDCSDLWSSPMNGKNSALSSLRQKIISGAEKRIIQKADVISCTSEFLRDKVVEKRGNIDHVYVFENGVEFSLFAQEEEKASGVLPEDFNGSVLGFIGGIKPKLDFTLIAEVAKQRPEWLFLFVGPDGTGQNSQFQDLLVLKNVVWTGSIPADEVPKYMNLIDIGIMPYKKSPYNAAVFPLKLFEFLAAGKPVVGVHLPSTKNYVEVGSYTHLETISPSNFLNACEHFIESKGSIEEVRRRQELAKKKDWNVIFKRMLETCHAVPATVRTESETASPIAKRKAE